MVKKSQFEHLRIQESIDFMEEELLKEERTYDFLMTEYGTSKSETVCQGLLIKIDHYRKVIEFLKQLEITINKRNGRH